MRRLFFLAPAAIAGVLAASFAVFLNLGATSSYVLIGVFGIGVVGLGIFTDLFIAFRERHEVVKVHEATIRAEEGYGPKAAIRDFSPGFVERWDKERIYGRPPLRVAARRARPNILFFQERKKRVKAEVRFGHSVDPTPLTRA